jgi:hypothetical protein
LCISLDAAIVDAASYFEEAAKPLVVGRDLCDVISALAEFMVSAVGW